MRTAIPNVHSTCPVVFLEWTRHHNTWGKLISLRHFLEISLTLGRKCVTFPQYTQGTHHSGGPPLTLTPEWAETLGFSSTINYCWINSKKYECQTSQCETHQAPPFHTLNNWGGSPISEVIIKKQTNKQNKPVHSLPFVWNKGPTLYWGHLGCCCHERLSCPTFQTGDYLLCLPGKTTRHEGMEMWRREILYFKMICGLKR